MDSRQFVVEKRNRARISCHSALFKLGLELFEELHEHAEHVILSRMTRGCLVALSMRVCKRHCREPYWSVRHDTICAHALVDKRPQCMWVSATMNTLDLHDLLQNIGDRICAYCLVS